MSRPEELAANLRDVRARITAACSAAARDPAEVTLVAVSKTWPAADVLVLRDLGVGDFAENRHQEAADKAALVPDVRWHFVGRLQSNKARAVASYADVVQSVDRASLVPALSDGARSRPEGVEVLVQVSLDGDRARGGALPADVGALADGVISAPGLRLAGIMAVAPLGADAGAAYAVLQQVSEELRTSHPGATVISAGMSGDLEQALANGATSVRVGTALFGPRGGLLR
ncbi:MAG TPA: YggS family pyridoxal phosphate-dependent enzyme [Mycobacteriales bacterium]|nr:YggS family pyridoxal phosphate-dependent enzyme [Mycobacteriales bacterium]